MKPATIWIDYTNHAGIRAARQIAPIAQNALRWGSTEWHREEQWLLDAYDVAKDDMRTFAVKDIHAWGVPACALKYLHEPHGGRQDRIEDSIARQLQLSMERNARMATRLQKLQSRAETINPCDWTPHQLLIWCTVNFPAAIAAIVKDEEPTWPPSGA